MMNTNKKILLVTFSDNADHQEVIYSLFEELLDYKCDVYTLGIINPKVEHINSNRIKFVNAPLRPGICKGTFNLLELSKVLYFALRGNFDIVYFETLHVWNIPFWFFHSNKTKIIQVIHDVDPHEGDTAVKSIEKINKLSTKFANYILLRSDKFVDLLSKKYGITKDRIKFLDPWRRFPQYKDITFSHRALFFGRINNYKGVEYLQTIVSSCPDITFDIVGKVDPLEASLVEDLKKFKNVNLDTNYVTDSQMKEYFHNADFVILPYKSASQSGVILDANKFGRLPIAFGVGAIKYQIENHVNGILIEPGNVKAFSDAINELASYDRERLSDFSMMTYKYGFMRYSSKKAASKFLKMINEV